MLGNKLILDSKLLWKQRAKSKELNKRAMMALGRSPEYHWNQIISKSVHRFSRRSRLKFFSIYNPGAILFNRVERFEQFL